MKQTLKNLAVAALMMFAVTTLTGTLAQAAMASVDIRSGAVRAIVGGRKYEVRRGLNRATQIRRQPGLDLRLKLRQGRPTAPGPGCCRSDRRCQLCRQDQRKQQRDPPEETKPPGRSVSVLFTQVDSPSAKPARGRRFFKFIISDAPAKHKKNQDFLRHTENADGKKRSSAPPDSA